MLQVGRQAKAGCNPFTIQVADKAFLDDSKLDSEDFAGKRSESAILITCMAVHSIYAGGNELSKPYIAPRVARAPTKQECLRSESEGEIRKSCVAALYFFCGHRAAW